MTFLHRTLLVSAAICMLATNASAQLVLDDVLASEGPLSIRKRLTYDDCIKAIWSREEADNMLKTGTCVIVLCYPEESAFDVECRIVERVYDVMKDECKSLAQQKCRKQEYYNKNVDEQIFQ